MMDLGGIDNTQWIEVHDGDVSFLSIYNRHYSRYLKSPGKRFQSKIFIGPGEKLLLRTLNCDAIFAWRYSRYHSQSGVECNVFRNESTVLSSQLIQEAVLLAWKKWPGVRLFTYVDATKITSVNPGYCFKQAGWQYCGMTKHKSLHILAIEPDTGVDTSHVAPQYTHSNLSSLSRRRSSYAKNVASQLRGFGNGSMVAGETSGY